MSPSDMSNMLLTQFILLLIFLRVHERLAIRFIVLQLLYSLPVYSAATETTTTGRGARIAIIVGANIQPEIFWAECPRCLVSKIQSYIKFWIYLKHLKIMEI